MDYAITVASPLSYSGIAWDGGSGGVRLGFVAVPWDCIRPGLENLVDYTHGPFRASVIVPDWTSHSSYRRGPADIAFGISSWTGRDSFAYWQDGTSNQIIFGEKAIPIGKVNACSAATGHWDCSYMTATAATFSLIGRSFENGAGGSLPIVRPDDERNESMMSFGSYHPGVANFVLGDGSVRGISITTPADTILYPLARADSGLAVSLP